MNDYRSTMALPRSPSHKARIAADTEVPSSGHGPLGAREVLHEMRHPSHLAGYQDCMGNSAFQPIERTTSCWLVGSSPSQRSSIWPRLLFSVVQLISQRLRIMFDSPLRCVSEAILLLPFTIISVLRFASGWTCRRQ